MADSGRPVGWAGDPLRANVNAGNFQLDKAGGPSDHARRVQFVSASTSALRRRVDGLREKSRRTGDVSGQGEDIDTATREVRNLMMQLKPLAAVAGEFKVKWERQKAQLMSHRESEIEAYLRREDEATSERSRAAAQEEMAAISFNSEMRSAQISTSLNNEHRPTLQKVVDHWRLKNPSADQVGPSAVTKAVNEKLRRVGAWATEEEHVFMDSWLKELTHVLTTAHNMDELAMGDMEDTQQARRHVLDVEVRRQKGELGRARDDLQERLAAMAEELQSPPQTSDRRTGAQKAHESTAIARAAKNRLAKAKSEAMAAMDAHIGNAVHDFEQATLAEQLRTANFVDAMEMAAPKLKERLHDELEQLATAAQVAVQAREAREAKQRAAKEKALAAKSNGVSRMSSPSRSPQRSGNVTPVQGRPGSPTGTPGSPSRGRRPTADDDDAASVDLENEGMTADQRETLAKRAHEQQVKALRKNLRVVQTSLANGDWNGDWRHDIAEVAEIGQATRRTAESALERQAAVLRGEDAKNQDSMAMRNALGQIQQHADTHAARVRTEFTRMSNAKVALARSRAAHMQELTHHYETLVLESEGAIFPGISRLAKDLEAVLEVGHALRHGAERLPKQSIAGPWRSTIKTSLQILQRLWDGAEVPEADRKVFVENLAALLGRHPLAESMFQDSGQHMDILSPHY